MGKRLPKAVFSMFGKMQLLRQPGACPEKAFGVFRPNERHVAIHEQTAEDLGWPTYWHEATHVALFETGCMNVLKEEEMEAVCDAMGLYLSKMMDAGMLKVITPRTPQPNKKK